MVQALPADFWDKEVDNLLAELVGPLKTTAANSANTAAASLQRLGIFIDPTLTNAEAETWARQHAGELIRQITQTNQKLVADTVADWVATPGKTSGELNADLRRILGIDSGRANRIAVTETTRALAAGSSLAYEAAGIAPAAYLPAAHPNCYCSVAPKRLPNGDWVQVWYTNRDEKVCRQVLNTPWGQVQGCRALHGVIVSTGSYLGRKFSDVEAEQRQNASRHP